MSAIKTLIIAPYKGLKDAISELLYKYPGIDADIYVANLNDAVTLLDVLRDNKYEVIISRGGTSEILRQNTRIPVVDIPISIYDLLRGIKMAEALTEKVVIGGFRLFTESAETICRLLQYDIPVLTIPESEQTDELIDEIVREYGDDGVVVGDRNMYVRAKERGLRAILVTSGRESIEEALLKAVTEARNKRKDWMLIRCFQQYLENNNMKMIVFDNTWESIFGSEFTEKEQQWINRMVEDVKNNRVKGTVWRQQFGDRFCELEYSVIGEEADKLNFFALKELMKLPAARKKALNAYTYREVSEWRKENIKLNTEYMVQFRKQLQNYGNSEYPVLLIGEPGSGMEQGAAYIYEHSNRTEQPLYVLDMRYITIRQLHHFSNQEASPFYDKGATIFVKNLQVVDRESFETLVENIFNPVFYKHNKYILSFVKEDQLYNEEYMQILSNQKDVRRVFFPVLRDRKEHFKDLCVLYLNVYNNELGKQVIGFTSSAMELMKNFSWPYNLDQLLRVLKELVMKSTSPYIRYEDVDEILQQESHKSGIILKGQYGVNTDRTLKEINRDIISYVIDLENGNQTKAAKRLGISRGTIWRMLKE